MGKTGKKRLNRDFFIHRYLGRISTLFNRRKREKFSEGFSTEFLSTFHNLCGKHYRQELIFAVISRMLFCRAVSPICNAFSIFSTE